MLCYRGHRTEDTNQDKINPKNNTFRANNHLKPMESWILIIIEQNVTSVLILVDQA